MERDDKFLEWFCSRDFAAPGDSFDGSQSHHVLGDDAEAYSVLDRWRRAIPGGWPDAVADADGLTWHRIGNAHHILRIRGIVDVGPLIELLEWSKAKIRERCPLGAEWASRCYCMDAKELWEMTLRGEPAEKTDAYNDANSASMSLYQIGLYVDGMKRFPEDALRPWGSATNNASLQKLVADGATTTSWDYPSQELREMLGIRDPRSRVGVVNVDFALLNDVVRRYMGDVVVRGCEALEARVNGSARGAE